MAFGIQAGVHVTSQYSVAGALRFVQRGEKRILQQEWTVKTTFSDTSASSQKEWRDVPLFAEEVRQAYTSIGGSAVDHFPLANGKRATQGAIERSRESFADFSSKETIYPLQETAITQDVE